METVDCYVGIDLGGTHVALGLVCDDKVVNRREFSVQAALGIGIYVKKLEESIDSMLAESGNLLLKGIGLSFPGLVDVVNRKVTSTYGKYDDAKDFDFVAWADSKWGVKIAMDIDARMALIGEWQYGAGRGYDNVLMITLGTGIGTSVVIEGKVLRGKHFQAGCLGGHIITGSDGPECSCGGKGCVEAYAGSWSVDRQVKTSPLYGSSSLNIYAKVGYRELFTEAANGDALAISVKEKALHAISSGIVSLIHAYDPEIVVIGGAVMNSKDIVLAYVRSFVSRYAISDWGEVKVESSELMNDAAILGANYCLKAEEKI